ncbi:hypothetical protein ACVIGB_001753 [Bradyrhizobium sp. USDA 4341]
MLGLLGKLDGVQHRAPLDIVIETKRRSNNRPKAYGIYASLWAWLHPETMRQGMRGVDDRPWRTDQSAWLSIERP